MTSSRSIEKQQNGVTGSINDMSTRTGKSVAEVAAECEALVIIDKSSSMRDILPNGNSRFEEANLRLKNLQAKYEGKIMVMSFDTEAKFHFDGQVDTCSGGTQMEPALELAFPLDEVLDIIMISDGAPWDPNETLKLAKSFRGPIYTLFIGEEGESGADFMLKLAKATGGVFEADPEKIFDMLTKRVTLLLTGGTQ